MCHVLRLPPFMAASKTAQIILQAAPPFPCPMPGISPPEITVGPDNSVFTVDKTGDYLISCHVNITAALKLGTRLMINSLNAKDSVTALVAVISSVESRSGILCPQAFPFPFRFTPILPAAPL